MIYYTACSPKISGDVQKMLRWRWSKGMVLTDLSKVYDCFPYDLLVAKLHAYGFSLSSLKMIYSYLTSRKQRVKIKSTYISWLDIKS